MQMLPMSLAQPNRVEQARMRDHMMGSGDESCRASRGGRSAGRRGHMEGPTGSSHARTMECGAGRGFGQVGLVRFGRCVRFYTGCRLAHRKCIVCS